MHPYALTSFMFASNLLQVPYFWKQQRPRQFWEVIIVNHNDFFYAHLSIYSVNVLISTVYVHDVLYSMYLSTSNEYMNIYFCLFIYICIHLSWRFHPAF